MKMKLKKILSIILGLACGLINGFLGSGGGIIAVQSMEKLGKDSKKSHATALLVILPLSIISAFVYYRNGSIVFDGNTWAEEPSAGWLGQCCWERPQQKL